MLANFWNWLCGLQIDIGYVMFGCFCMLGVISFISVQIWEFIVSRIRKLKEPKYVTINAVTQPTTAWDEFLANPDAVLKEVI